MKIDEGVFASAPRLMMLGLLAVSLHACSSSGSGGSGGTLFSDPVDSSSLRSALITGSSAGDNAQYWECAVADGSATYEYRLMADGSGVENDRANPTVSSAFTWQADSATTATISVTASGMQNQLSDIRFTDGDNMSLVVAEQLPLSCARKGGAAEVPDVVDDPAPSNALTYGSAVYVLTHGFERVFQGYLSSGRSHVSHRFCVADAPFEAHYNTTIGLGQGGVSWYADDGTVSFCAELYVPVDFSLEAATFSFVSDDAEEQNNPLFSGQYFANNGLFDIDLNGDGSTASDENERLDVTGGAVAIRRVSGDIVNMQFDVVLENGATVSGSFEGEFLHYDDSV